MRDDPVVQIVLVTIRRFVAPPAAKRQARGVVARGTACDGVMRGAQVEGNSKVK
jgi:hypothetical protein